MKTLIVHNLLSLERLTEELYKLLNTPCYSSAMALARRKLFELSFQLAAADIPENVYKSYMLKLAEIQTNLDLIGRGKCKGIKMSIS